MYKINRLLQQENQLFHTQDLALLWNITNRNTLYTQIKRYVKSGILRRIHKGFYSTVPLEKLDPVYLGIRYLHDYAYLSGEFVLAKHGVIFQHSDYITLISSASTKFSINNNQYWVRSLKQEFLYKTIGIIKHQYYYEATVERAMADLLYYLPKKHFDNYLINWQKVSKIQKEMEYI